MTRPTLLALLATLPLLTCCNEGDDEDTIDYYTLRTPPHPVAPTSKLLTSGKWLVYLASEANYTPAGTDMNGDGDVIDEIAVRIDVFTNKRKELDTAVQDMALVNGTLFLVVLEASDGRDWNADGDTSDRVIVYQTPAETLPTFFAEVDLTSGMVMLGLQTQVFFTSAVAPTIAGDTNLFVASVSSNGSIPTPATRITTAVVADGDGASVRILGEAEDVLFLGMDENLDGDLNGDADGVDSSVLSVLDASSLGSVIQGTSLALGSTYSLTAATSGADRIVAFLVNETAQGDNLNDESDFSGTWQPPGCTALGDVDFDDDVLHWMLMADFEAGGTIQNTGLVGTAGERLYAHPTGFVGCASLEADEGLGAGCDMNGDGDTDDRIFRWTSAVNPGLPVLPETDPSRLMALVTSVPGAVGDSTGGVLVAGKLWVILVDEAADGRDHDGDPGTDNDLIGAKDPSLVGQGWNFFHSKSQDVPAGVPVGATWMATDIQTANRNLIAIEESVTGIDQNGDGDLVDSFPTFPKVQSGSALTFPGIALAVSSTNAGIVTAAGVGYFRVSEAAEGGTDFNTDGDVNDFILSRVGVTNSEPLVHMATLNNLDRPAVQFDSMYAPKFGVVLFQESMQGPSGKDLNNDGDANDFVPRYFRIDN